MTLVLSHATLHVVLVILSGSIAQWDEIECGPKPPERRVEHFSAENGRSMTSSIGAFLQFNGSGRETRFIVSTCETDPDFDVVGRIFSHAPFSRNREQLLPGEEFSINVDWRDDLLEISDLTAAREYSKCRFETSSTNNVYFDFNVSAGETSYLYLSAMDAYFASGELSVSIVCIGASSCRCSCHQSFGGCICERSHRIFGGL